MLSGQTDSFIIIDCIYYYLLLLYKCRICLRILEQISLHIPNYVQGGNKEISEEEQLCIQLQQSPSTVSHRSLCHSFQHMSSQFLPLQFS